MHTPHEIVDLYARKGGLRYAGEPVTQLQHAWQCAQLAARAGAAPALRLAAWLHDIGHLYADDPGTPTLAGVDDRHERMGAAALRPLFGDAVAAPVALHVDAKRYLVGARPGYFARLSEESVRSLALQGGPMADEERARFESLPFFADALRLRAWDDAAKAGDWAAPDPEIALAELAGLMAAVKGEAAGRAAADRAPG